TSIEELANLHHIIVERDVPAAMRDGTTLYADIWRPEGRGPWPVLLIRQPYDKAHAETFTYAHPSWYARHGYIVVSQDVRGRWSSEGEFYPFRHEAEDGYDTVEWAAGLSASNGRVGMYGFSYGGFTQLAAATVSPPHLTCIVPALVGSQMYEGWAYNGGANALAFNLSWTLYLAADTARRKGLAVLREQIEGALRTAQSGCFWQLPMDELPLPGLRNIAPYFFDWLAHPSYDEYWRQWSIDEHYDRIGVPGLHIGGWYDIFRDGVIRNFLGISAHGATDLARKGQKLVVGPWFHAPWTRTFGSADFGSEAGNPVDDLQLRWFDYWLSGVKNGVMDEPPVRAFVMGENRWRWCETWPPASVRPEPVYLHSGGRANSFTGDGFLDTRPPEDELPDVFVYDPNAPTPSAGGQSCCLPDIVPMGPRDQRNVEISNQVLVYTTKKLGQPLTIAGPVAVELFASSSAPDTDFTAKLVDVAPEGRAVNITNGILRAKYRDSIEHPAPIGTDEIIRFTINAGSTAWTFQQRHAIRLEISSSDFPCWDRNTNTGRNPLADRISDLRTATNTVYHDRLHTSRLILPVQGEADTT
ncbi:MAG: CocE/NonD family hydrolase, partial [Methanoregulaceae archaeon]|nr:CocE/NonD family hydrolase [Methanoregulaceae archaeon]